MDSVSSSLVDLLHKSRAIGLSKYHGDTITEEEEIGLVTRSLLTLEANCDDFDSFEFIMRIKSILAGGFENNPDLEGQVVIGRHQVGLDSVRQFALKEIAIAIDSVSANEALLAPVPSTVSRHKKKRSGEVYSSFDFDNFPDYEPLELTLACLRQDAGSLEALTKLLNMDAGELIGHMQWCELLSLLWSSLKGTGPDCSVVIKSLMVHVKLMCGLPAPQNVDIIFNLLGYFKTKWTASEPSTVAISKDFTVEDLGALGRIQLQTFVSLLRFFASQVIDPTQEKDCNCIISTIFFLIAHGFIPFVDSEESRGSSSEGGSAVTRVGCLLIDAIAVLTVEEGSSVDAITMKWHPESVLSHAIHSGFMGVLNDRLCRASSTFTNDTVINNGRRRQLLLDSRIWLSLLRPFSKDSATKDFVCKFSARVETEEHKMFQEPFLWDRAMESRDEYRLRDANCCEVIKMETVNGMNKLFYQMSGTTSIMKARTSSASKDDDVPLNITAEAADRRFNVLFPRLVDVICIAFQSSSLLVDRDGHQSLDLLNSFCDLVHQCFHHAASSVCSAVSSHVFHSLVEVCCGYKDEKESQRDVLVIAAMDAITEVLMSVTGRAESCTLLPVLYAAQLKLTRRVLGEDQFSSCSSEAPSMLSRSRQIDCIMKKENSMFATLFSWFHLITCIAAQPKGNNPSSIVFDIAAAGEGVKCALGLATIIVNKMPRIIVDCEDEESPKKDPRVAAALLMAAALGDYHVCLYLARGASGSSLILCAFRDLLGILCASYFHKRDMFTVRSPIDASMGKDEAVLGVLGTSECQKSSSAPSASSLLPSQPSVSSSLSPSSYAIDGKTTTNDKNHQPWASSESLVLALLTVVDILPSKAMPIISVYDGIVKVLAREFISADIWDEAMRSSVDDAPIFAIVQLLQGVCLRGGYDVALNVCSEAWSPLKDHLDSLVSRDTAHFVAQMIREGGLGDLEYEGISPLLMRILSVSLLDFAFVVSVSECITACSQSTHEDIEEVQEGIGMTSLFVDAWRQRLSSGAAGGARPFSGLFDFLRALNDEQSLRDVASTLSTLNSQHFMSGAHSSAVPMDIGDAIASSKDLHDICIASASIADSITNNDAYIMTLSSSMHLDWPLIISSLARPPDAPPSSSSSASTKDNDDAVTDVDCTSSQRRKADLIPLPAAMSLLVSDRNTWGSLQDAIHYRIVSFSSNVSTSYSAQWMLLACALASANSSAETFEDRMVAVESILTTSSAWSAYRISAAMGDDEDGALNYLVAVTLEIVKEFKGGFVVHAFRTLGCPLSLIVRVLLRQWLLGLLSADDISFIAVKSLHRGPEKTVCSVAAAIVCTMASTFVDSVSGDDSLRCVGNYLQQEGGFEKALVAAEDALIRWKNMFLTTSDTWSFDH